jgi:hypothetical protein
MALGERGMRCSGKPRPVTLIRIGGSVGAHTLRALRDFHSGVVSGF